MHRQLELLQRTCLQVYFIATTEGPRLLNSHRNISVVSAELQHSSTISTIMTGSNDVSTNPQDNHISLHRPSSHSPTTPSFQLPLWERAILLSYHYEAHFNSATTNLSQQSTRCGRYLSVGCDCINPDGSAFVFNLDRPLLQLALISGLVLHPCSAWQKLQLLINTPKSGANLLFLPLKEQQLV